MPGRKAELCILNGRRRDLSEKESGIWSCSSWFLIGKVVDRSEKFNAILRDDKTHIHAPKTFVAKSTTSDHNFSANFQ